MNIICKNLSCLFYALIKCTQETMKCAPIGPPLGAGGVLKIVMKKRNASNGPLHGGKQFFAQ